MKFGYYLSAEAEHDIDEIITYIAQENPTAAHTFLDAVYETMEKVNQHRYRDSGSYDWDWLFTPTGKQIKLYKIED